jgi:beta-glucosidase-like glycosyl hydrolase
LPRPNNLKHNITITKRKYTLPKLISLIAISQSILLSSVLITSCGSGKLTDPVRQAADESIVMLRNNQSKLPLTQNDTVSIFGRTQIDYHFMGGGSGGLVVPKYTVNVLQGLRNSNLKINEDLASIYEN